MPRRTDLLLPRTCGSNSGRKQMPQRCGGRVACCVPARWVASGRISLLRLNSALLSSLRLSRQWHRMSPRSSGYRYTSSLRASFNSTLGLPLAGARFRHFRAGHTSRRRSPPVPSFPLEGWNPGTRCYYNLLRIRAGVALSVASLPRLRCKSLPWCIQWGWSCDVCDSTTHRLHDGR